MTDDVIQEEVRLLLSSLAMVGCKAMDDLLDESKRNPSVYPYFDQFVTMIDSESSYIRTRGLLLIAANAKWDTEHKINKIINKYLTHITDPKPITSRQFIQALPTVAKEKKELIIPILNALESADSSKYNSSMQPLVQKDIECAMEEIHRMEKEED